MSAVGPFAEAAPRLWSAGLPVLPLHRWDATDGHGKKIGKAVAVQGWPRYCRNLPTGTELRAWRTAFPAGNIGLALGPASGLVAIDIDTDDPSVEASVVRLLRPSPWRRVGRKGCVLLYPHTDGLASCSVPVPGGGQIDVLADGRQVVLPPSIHPDTGKPYAANADLVDVLDQVRRCPPVPKDIKARLQAVLGPQMPAGRSSDLLREARKILKGVGPGRAHDRVRDAVFSFAKAMGHDAAAWSEFKKEIQSTFCEKYPAGLVEHATDARLEESFAGALSRISKLDQAKTEVLDGYVFDIWNLVFRHITDPSGFVLNDDQFFRSHGSELELKHPAHVQFLVRDGRVRKVFGTVMVPNGPIIVPRQGVGDRLNVWVNPRFERGDDFDAGPFLDFMSKLYPDADARQYQLQWMAHAVQRPQERVSHASLLIGEATGTGKSTVGRILRRLLGEENCGTVNTDMLRSQFNGFLENKLLMVIEEAMTRGRADIANRLKPIITEATIPIERKGLDTYHADNLARLFITSNHENAILVDEEDRRYFVYVTPVTWRDFGRTEADATTYFERLNGWLDDGGGIAAVWNFMMSMDISTFNPNARPPVNASKRRVVEATAHPLLRRLRTKIEGAAFPFDQPVFSVDQIRGVPANDPGEIGRLLLTLGCSKLMRDGEHKQVRVSGSGGRSTRPRPWVTPGRADEAERLMPGEVRSLLERFG
ncbi:MAG: DUF5906 domain-containing protein [Rhodospirillales bacterium]